MNKLNKVFAVVVGIVLLVVLGYFIFTAKKLSL